jgi:hypothetical protein
MHYTKVKPLIEQCGVVWEEGKNIQVGKKELCMFADLLVETKILTDGEIDAVGDEVSNLIDTYAGRREFAKAILRKAQEK